MENVASPKMATSVSVGVLLDNSRRYTGIITLVFPSANKGVSQQKMLASTKKDIISFLIMSPFT